MKRLLGLTLCVMFILSTTLTFAAPVGNIATPAVIKKGLFIQDQQGQYGIIAVSENDVTWDRNLKDQFSDSQYNFFGGKVGVVFVDKYVVYGLIGGAQAKQKFTISGVDIKWDTKYDLAWGVGGTAILYETQVKEMGNGILRIGIDGRYRQSHLDVDKIVASPGNFNINNATATSSKYEFADWQAALALAYQVDKFVPYVGVKYSDAVGEATVTAGGTEFKIDFEGADNVGVFAGMDVLLNDSFSIGCEGRFIDETAVTGAATLKF